MRNVGRKLAFVLAASNHGTMILNRFDYRMTGADSGIGVGFQLLEAGAFDPLEVELALQLIEARRRFHGDGVVGIDCGANIGVHTIEWATAMTGWGSVVAIEAQERIYYALAGNIAINNCFNAIAMHAAVSSEPGIMSIPVPDYFTPSSFGSLELKPRADTEFIGQPIDYSNTVAVQKISIDALSLPRVDFIKLDIEGMELEALTSAAGRSSWWSRSRPGARPCAPSSTSAATRWPMPASTCWRSTRAIRSPTNCRCRSRRRNPRRPKRQRPSARRALRGKCSPHSL